MPKKRANGEGSLRKRKDGRWEGRYTAGYNAETGKRIIKNVLGKTQAECKAKLAAAMEATKGVDISRADEYTVATWLRSWYDIYAKPNVRVATADRYRLMIEQYAIPRIGSIKLTKLTAHDLQKLYKKLMESGRTNRKSGHGNPGLSSTTVRSLHLMLHSALERAVKERLILRNPTEDCIAPKVQKFEMQILQPEHIKTYLDAADKRGLLPMFYLELVSGLRKGELTALLWSDLDIADKTISVRSSFALSAHFPVWVTVWVRRLTHILTRTVFNIYATKKHRKPKFSMLFGAAGRIRTADLILTKKPWMLLRRTHSYQGRTSNPLCCKGLEVLIMLVSFNTYRGVLCRFRVFVGRTVGNRLVSTGVKVLI